MHLSQKLCLILVIRLVQHSKFIFNLHRPFCSYDTVSNFGMDTIIKKIPCTAGYNKMIFQSSGSTLDGLDVSKRTLRFLDFKLDDSNFRPIPLQGNHFSFSMHLRTQHLTYLYNNAQKSESCQHQRKFHLW